MKFEEEVKCVISDFIRAYDGNMFACDADLEISIFGHKIEVESLWSCKDEHKYYLHCNCNEFEGDLDVSSLSDKNQKHIIEVLKSYH